MKMWLGPVLLYFLYGSVFVQGDILGEEADVEATLTATQLIEYWGYPCETHEVTTSDGYILSLFRIPHGRKSNVTGSQSGRLPVFVQHGLMVDATIWYQNLPENSLAFMLADNGYDVWLPNSRGTTWSKKHAFLSPDSDKFWEFSYDEMAKYDLPASIDFVLQKTGHKQVYYIGHSQGTTIAFIAFSTNPALAEKIKMFFALAPVAYLKHAKTPLARLSPIPDINIMILFGHKAFMPDKYFDNTVRSTLCGKELLVPFCSNLLFIICGFNEENLNMSRIDVYTAFSPAGTSVQNIIHWRQAVNSGEFQAYDYGRLRNRRFYKQFLPPKYDLTAMTVPTIIWSGENDWLSDPADVALLIPQIRNLIFHEYISGWNHLDFVLGLDAPEKLYISIIKVLNGFLPLSSS